MVWGGRQPAHRAAQHLSDTPRIQSASEEGHIGSEPAMNVQIAVELPKAGCPRAEHRVLLLTVHKARDVLDRGNSTPGSVKRPPRCPEPLDARQDNPIRRQGPNPVIRTPPLPHLPDDHPPSAPPHP